MPLAKWFVLGLLAPDSPQLELPSFFQSREEEGSREGKGKREPCMWSKVYLNKRQGEGPYMF